MERSFFLERSLATRRSMQTRGSVEYNSRNAGLSELTVSENSRILERLGALEDLQSQRRKQAEPVAHDTCQQLLHRTNRDIKKLMYKISHVIGEGFYKLIECNRWCHIELIEGIPAYFRIALRSARSLDIFFKYPDG